MTTIPEDEPIGYLPSVQSARPTVARATPVVVILILVLAQLFTRVEFSLILGR